MIKISKVKQKNMENILKRLFDYQKFENNENLDRIIKDSRDRHHVKLSDDTLYLLNAAGDILENKFLSKKKKKNSFSDS